MSGGTGISWTDETWNPVTGCSRVSEGCRNCYAAALAPRLAAMGQKGYTDLPWTKANAPENVFLHEDRLEKPIRWTRPRRVFVNSMSDLFHEQVPDEFIDRVFAVMALAPKHTFQILTKRPERMAEWFSMIRYRGVLTECLSTLIMLSPEIAMKWPLTVERAQGIADRGWPLPNVWVGTSVENQRAADERIPHLLRTPAAVRFLSCEPLLGALDLTDVHDRGVWRSAISNQNIPHDTKINALEGFWGEGWFSGKGEHVDWVIAGGESGPNYRPMNHDWMRSLRDQCAEAGVAFFGKQDSGTRNESELPEDLQVRQFPEVMLS